MYTVYNPSFTILQQQIFFVTRMLMRDLFVVANLLKDFGLKLVLI